MNRFLAASCVALASLVPSPVLARSAAFHFQADRVPVATAFEYRKSNRDGSNATDITVYVRDATHVESFKRWHDPTSRATLVQAQMDWQRWSVSGFQVHELNCAQPPQPRATLEATANEFRVSFMKVPVPLTRTPWHSYDFDFTSLSLVMPMLREPQRPFTFWRTDVVFEPELRLAEIGEVTMRFERLEQREGRATRRYTIGGPGLGDTAGTWWSDAATGTLVEFEIPVPDEPGYRDGRMVLLSTRPMDAQAWEAHKRESLCSAAH